MNEQKEAASATKKHISPWAAVIWLVFVAQGLVATFVELIWSKKIALPGILDAWVHPMPWWTGFAMAAVGGALLFWMHKRGIRVLD